jgi:hypothetical protein
MQKRVSIVAGLQPWHIMLRELLRYYLGSQEARLLTVNGKISSERKKELREQYKLMKPDMGVFAVVCKTKSRYYLEASEDMKSAINSTEFKLNAGMHPHRELQRDWQEIGRDGFEIRILERIEIDDQKDPKENYQDDLALLKMIWEERLLERNAKIYRS